jgi:hypothetical protein
MSAPIRRALYGKLAGDGTLTALLGPPAPGKSQAIYYDDAPENTPSNGYPFLIFTKMAGTPSYLMQSGTSAFDSDVWLVKGVDRNLDTDSVEAIQARVKALLTDATLNISGRRLMLLLPLADVDYAEEDKGTSFVHAGAQFRLTHQA